MLIIWMVLFENYNSLFDFIEYRKQKTLLLSAWNGIDLDIKGCHEQVSKYLILLQERYDEALKTMNIHSINEILDIQNKYGKFFNQIKNFTFKDESDSTIPDCLVQAMNKFKDYRGKISAISTEINIRRLKIVKCKLINDDTIRDTRSRNDFYRNLDALLYDLERAKKLDFEVDKAILSDFPDTYKNSIIKLERDIDEISNEMESQLLRLEHDQKACEKFNINYSNLFSLRDNIRCLSNDSGKRINEIEAKLYKHIDNLEKSIGDGFETEAVAGCLLRMKYISDQIIISKKLIDEKINQILDRYKLKKKGSAPFHRLMVVLSGKNGGGSIISEYKQFRGDSTSIWNRKTQQHGIEHVLGKLETGNGKTADEFLGMTNSALKSCYKVFKDVYRNLIETYLAPNEIDYQAILSKIQSLILSLKKPSENKEGHIEWSESIRKQIPILLAHLFALWTLKNSSHYYEDALENSSKEDKEFYLWQPHAAQVVALFRMFNLDYLQLPTRKAILENNLVQILTGEGKSITLAMAASLLALLNFDVSCACYSSYLSERDYQDFKWLFDLLDITGSIHYGTFNTLCERVINKEGQLRSRVKELIRGGDYSCSTANIIHHPKVLLIDEVDVFFNKDFYGNLYIPSVSLKDPTINALVNYIWKNKLLELTPAMLEATKEYKACVSTFVGWEFLIREAVKDMLADVRDFTSHDYEIKADKICYKNQDSFSSSIIYGYKTMFAYYQEHEKGKISAASLSENVAIEIRCGKFSYAEIPHQFNSIMGVTGTLKSLSDPERAIINTEYKINKYTCLPSVYGDKKIEDEPHLTICPSENFFINLVEEIKGQLRGRLSGTRRAVMVFFETEKLLREFYTSSNLATLRDSVNLPLTESVEEPEKSHLVKKATVAGRVTLLTRTFGRGVDFICYDDEVANNGGVHIIQTFLSEELSEEIQIKGRTARQGQQGSYSLLLKKEELQKFLIYDQDIEDAKKSKNLYTMLNDKRNAFFKQQYEQNRKYLVYAKKEHKSSIDFLSALSLGGDEKKPGDAKSELMIAMPTRGEGDCPFHSILGTWDETEASFIVPDIENVRKKVGNTIRRIRHPLISSKNSPPDWKIFGKEKKPEKPDIKVVPLTSHDSLRKLCIAGIQELVMANQLRGIGKRKINLLLKAYRDFLNQQNTSRPTFWMNFEFELNKQSNAEILKFINHHGADAGTELRDRFYRALNVKEGELYARILSLPELDHEFHTFNMLCNAEFDWTAYWEPQIFMEYAAFIEKKGQWLLPLELETIAYVFKLTVIYHPSKTAIPQILNGGKDKTVHVIFVNGNHYSRVVNRQQPIVKNIPSSTFDSQKFEIIKEFLTEQNKGAYLDVSSRTICLMDATLSMSHLLQKAKTTVGNMFIRAYEILKEQGVSDTFFQMQFAVYRNYNSPIDKILEVSPWESKPDNLSLFMNNIVPAGGDGNEAIEIGLWHANHELEQGNKVSQVILIGDAPPNEPDEIKDKRAQSALTEAGWFKSKFGPITTSDTEVKKLVNRGVPVHAFFVANRAQQAFEQIAKRSNGESEELDINTLEGSEKLTNLVTREILRIMGKVNLFLVSEFNIDQCKRIKGNAVILTDQNTAYFIYDSQIVIKDEKPQTVENINRLEILPGESIKPVEYTASVKLKEAIVSESIKRGGHTPKNLVQAYDDKYRITYK